MNTENAAMKSIWRKSGFTLVELMVTVAIVSLLAVIAIPSYKGYLKKSRQTEAKVNLGSIYMVETVHFNSDEHRTYSACLGVLGFIPEGQSYYSLGFSPVVSTYRGCTPSGASMGGTNPGNCLAYSYTANEAGQLSVLSQCQALENQIYFLAKKSEPGAEPLQVVMLGAILTWNTLEVIAAGAIGGDTLDIWTLREDKQIYGGN